MSIKKKVKCLVCRVLVKLGLKKTCKAPALPSITAEISKKDEKKTPRKSTRKSKSK